jgi:hypothetical protein
MYDLLRLLGLLWILPALIIIPETMGGIGVPLAVYAAPNVLFPLMSFFLLVKPEEHRPFVPLYLAGKAVAIVANLGWFFSSLGQLRLALAGDVSGIPDALGVLYILGFLLALAVLDAFSVLGMSAFMVYGPQKQKSDTLLIDEPGGTEPKDMVSPANPEAEE